MSNVQISQLAGVLVQASVFVAENRNDTSLLQALSIFRKLQIRNVLQDRPPEPPEMGFNPPLLRLEDICAPRAQPRGTFRS